jgi:hypothetical protein
LGGDIDQASGRWHPPNKEIVLIIHSVKKLITSSRLSPALFISRADDGQKLHSWYARLLNSGFPGRMMVMYVHEPSLMAVVCKGKTIQGTMQQMPLRLEGLLTRFHFPKSFIRHELSLTDGYVVSKTNSKSLLSFMNQMVYELEYECSKYGTYEAIPLETLEDNMMERLYQSGRKWHDYRTPLKYWQAEAGLGSQ